jgi:hypothetical protein
MKRPAVIMPPIRAIEPRDIAAIPEEVKILVVGDSDGSIA